MIYQLPTGRIIEISIEQYLEMSDDDVEYFIAYEIGEFAEDPFFGSMFYNQKHVTIEPDITTLDSVEKLSDLDIEIPEE